MNKKAAIEFSANVIVIIIISSVILGLGLMLFFNLKGQAERYTDTIEQQTAEQLKALMLNDNSRVAVYPNDLTIQPGKSQMTTVAVNNQLGNNQLFYSNQRSAIKVELFESPTLPPQIISPQTSPPWWNNEDAIILSKSTESQNHLSAGRINPGEQGFRNILIKMPKTAKKGQYVFTVEIKNSTTGMCFLCTPYGLVKLYVTVP